MSFCVLDVTVVRTVLSRKSDVPWVPAEIAAIIRTIATF